MAKDEQKPDEPAASGQPTGPAESAAPTKEQPAEPLDLVDAFADDELSSYEPRRAGIGHERRD